MKKDVRKNTSLFIYGRKPIEEALLADPRNIKMVYMKESIKDTEVSELKKHLSKYKIIITKVPENRLVRLVGDVNTQGFVAELKEFKKEQREHQIEYINTGKLNQEKQVKLQNDYNKLIQNEDIKKLLETEIRLDIILADMQKIIAEGIKEIIDF